MAVSFTREVLAVGGLSQGGDRGETAFRERVSRWGQGGDRLPRHLCLNSWTKGDITSQGTRILAGGITWTCSVEVGHCTS